MKLKFRWSKAGMMAQAPSSSLLCYSYRSTSCHDPRWWPECLLLLPELTPDPHSKPVSLVQSLSYVRLFVTPWTEACQASLSITNFQSLIKLMSIESVIPSNHLILCSPLLLPPSVSWHQSLFRWPKYRSFSFSISPSNKYSGLISFKMDCLDLLAVQGALKSLQHHSPKASIIHTQLSL